MPSNVWHSIIVPDKGKSRKAFRTHGIYNVLFSFLQLWIDTSAGGLSVEGIITSVVST